MAKRWCVHAVSSVPTLRSIWLLGGQDEDEDEEEEEEEEEDTESPFKHPLEPYMYIVPGLCNVGYQKSYENKFRILF